MSQARGTAASRDPLAQRGSKDNSLARVPVTCTGPWFLPAGLQASSGREGTCHRSSPGWLLLTSTQESWTSGFKSYKEGMRLSKQPLGAGPLARGLPAWITGLPAGCWAFGVIPHKHLLGPGNKLSAWPLVQVFLSGGRPEGTALGDCVQPGHRVNETCRCLPASPGERPQSPWGRAWFIVGAQ